MNELSKEAKQNQHKLMKQILSLKGSLLTKEQKHKILHDTDRWGILEGFRIIDRYEYYNRSKK